MRILVTKPGNSAETRPSSYAYLANALHRRDTYPNGKLKESGGTTILSVVSEQPPIKYPRIYTSHSKRDRYVKKVGLDRCVGKLITHEYPMYEIAEIRKTDTTWVILLSER